MSSLSQGPFGVYSQAVAVQIQQALISAGFVTTGKVYYCDPKNGNDLNNGQQPVNAQGQAGIGPVQSLAAGYGLLSSGNNDILVLIGDGTTAATARIHSTFTWSKNAAHLVGVCAPSRVSQRARIAPLGTDTAFANFFVVSGNGCLFSNIQWFHGFNTGTTAEICMTVSGSRNVFQNCSIDGMGDAAGAADVGSRSLLLTAGENLFVNSSIGIDTISRTNANSSIEISGGAARNIFQNCILPMLAGSSAELFFLTAGAAAIDRYTLFKDCAFINAIASSGTGLTGGFKLAASSGGMVVIQNSFSVGQTAFGADATSKAQIYIATPITTNAGGIATVNT